LVRIYLNCRYSPNLAAHDAFLWLLELVFYACWFTLAVMALVSMGMKVLLVKQVWNDACGDASQMQQTLNHTESGSRTHP
jgi:hypothetical protein